MGNLVRGYASPVIDLDDVPSRRTVEVRWDDKAVRERKGRDYQMHRFKYIFFKTFFNKSFINILINFVQG